MKSHSIMEYFLFHLPTRFRLKFPFILLGSTVAVLFLFQCDSKLTSSGEDRSVSIQVVELGCDDALLKISLGSGIVNDTLIITRDDTVELYRGHLDIREKYIWDDDLAINHYYTWQAKLLNQPDSLQSTNSITLDTTSHLISWKIFEFGDWTSRLIDVEIYSPDSIVAVGDIPKIQLNGDPDFLYNTVIWDGISWKEHSIRTNGDLFIFNCIEQDEQGVTWIANQYDIVRIEKDHIEEIDIPEFTTFSILKAISDDYIVGVDYESNILFMNGYNRQKVGFENNYRIWDIDAKIILNKVNGYIIGYDSTYNFYLFEFRGNNYNKVITFPHNEPYYHIWMKNQYRLFLGGGYQMSYIKYGRNYERLNTNNLSVSCIKGPEINDLWFCSSDHIGHYNGSTIKLFSFPGFRFKGLDIKDDLICAVGRNDQSSVVVKGIHTR